MQTIPEILKKYPGALLSVVITHATIIIPDVDEAGATFAPAPGVEAGPYFEKEYLPLIASGVLVPEREGSTYFVLAKTAGGTVDEVLRLMSEVPGRELLVTALAGAYIYGPFNSFVAGPFETEDFKTLIDDGVLIESGRRQNTFFFNPQPPDFSNLNLGGSDHVFVSPAVRCGMSVCLGGLIKAARDKGHQTVVTDFKGELAAKFYTAEERAELLDKIGPMFVCAPSHTATVLANFYKQKENTNG